MADWRETLLHASPFNNAHVFLSPLWPSANPDFVVEQYAKFWHKYNIQGREGLYPSTPDSPQEIRDWLKQTSNDQLELVYFSYTQGELFGHLNLQYVGDNNGTDVLNLAYYNGRVDLRGRGLMHSSVSLLLESVGMLGLDCTIMAKAEKENYPSVAILESTLAKTGETSTHFHFAKTL